MTHHRPHDPEKPQKLEPEDLPDDSARESHATGGDAPAAGTIAEREALARDEDDVEQVAEDAEGPLGDLADEARRRREQGEGRGPHPPRGSEGAAGKIESGEW